MDEQGVKKNWNKAVLSLVCVILISGCTSDRKYEQPSAQSTISTSNVAGFNSEFKMFWDDVIVSSQIEYDRKYWFFMGYNIDEYDNLIVTTNTNRWFNLESYQRHQLLTTVGQAYNNLRVKYGLREGDVILKDTVGSEICRYTIWGSIKCK